MKLIGFFVVNIALIQPVVFVSAQEQANAPNEQAPNEQATSDVQAADEATLQALEPLFNQIKRAKSSRVSVEVSEDTIIEGAVVASKSSSYQIASTGPGKLTIYFKNDQQRSRIYSNPKTATIAVSPQAYTHVEPIGMQDAVFALPFPMGPYPEPVLALSLAGVDPALTLLNGMKSVVIADKKPFRGKSAAIHYLGIQDDAVQWDLWVSQGTDPKPLRLRVDLTEMLRANGSLELPPSYRFTLRFDFVSWKLNLQNNDALFEYSKLEGAREYESLQAYFDAQQPAEAPQQSAEPKTQDQ